MSEQVPTKEQCEGQACENTDRHLWPLVSKPDDPYESIHVTKEGNIGINVCGNVLVLPLREWHRRAGGTPGRGIGDEQPPSKDQMQPCPHGHTPGLCRACMRAEIDRLQTALRGIQSCGTCGACRGAATRALREGCAPIEQVGQAAEMNWMPFEAGVEFLNSRLMKIDPSYVLKNWEMKYIEVRVDMRTGAMLIRPDKPAHEREMPHCSTCSCPPYEPDAVEAAARARFIEVHGLPAHDPWELAPSATKEQYREWARRNAQPPGDVQG